MFGALSVQVCELHVDVWGGLQAELQFFPDLYYIAFPQDRPARKALVVFVYVMELAQTVMATHDIFAAVAAGWGTPGALDHIYWSCVDVPIMSSIRKSHLGPLF